MHPSQPRRGPAVRGFKPDIIGTSLLFVFLVVGQLLLTAVFWDYYRYIGLVSELGDFDEASLRNMVNLLIGIADASNYATGLAVFMLALGVKGRKLVSLVPFVICLSPFLNTFLHEPFFLNVGMNDLSYSMFWFVTVGIFYGAALAAWAYGFGRSAAGVAVAGCLGAVALTFYVLLNLWVSKWAFNLDGEEGIFVAYRILSPLGFITVMVVVIALSCLVGPGLARAPIALEPRYDQRSVAPPRQYGGAGPQDAAAKGSVAGGPVSWGSASWGAADPSRNTQGGQLGSGGSSVY